MIALNDSNYKYKLWCLPGGVCPGVSAQGGLARGSLPEDVSAQRGLADIPQDQWQTPLGLEADTPGTTGRQPPGTRGRHSSLPGPGPEADTPRQIQSTSSQYTSYWNAFLLQHCFYDIEFTTLQLSIVKKLLNRLVL